MYVYVEYDYCLIEKDSDYDDGYVGYREEIYSNHTITFSKNVRSDIYAYGQIPDDHKFAVCLTYRTGGSFGCSRGNFMLASSFADKTSADELHDMIAKSACHKKFEEAYYGYGDSDPEFTKIINRFNELGIDVRWIGYFEDLEKLWVESIYV